MRRRQLLADSGRIATASGLLVLAGCSSDGGETTERGDDSETVTDSSGGDVSTPGSDSTSTQSVDVSGTVARNTVSGLDVVDHTPTLDEGDFEVTATVENVGAKTVDSMTDYRYDLSLLDESGQKTAPAAPVTYQSLPGEVEPGETRDVRITILADDVSVDSIESHELSLTCPDGTATYCK